MDRQDEYHDPDYPGTSAGASRGASIPSEDEKVEKIRRIVCREFSNELDAREQEIMLIDQRSLTARRMLQRLRYAIVNNYYNEERLKLTASQIQDEVAAQSEPRAQASVSTLLREGQRRLHPSVRKLLGKQSSPVELHEILYRRRAPRNKARKDYQAMVQARNYTISADTTKSLRPISPSDLEATTSQAGQVNQAGQAGQTSQVGQIDQSVAKPKKMPRRFDPKVTNVVTLDEATRNQMKHRYRIIIGNTSKYAPPASSADRSTHKWLLYVRGSAQRPDISKIVTSVTVRLHHSYAPHHTVHIDAPPFHISRRGWGEFPAVVELRFARADRNRPAAVTHNIKLDRNYTGLQTLGAETVVDVWLYSNEEMLPYEFKEDTSDLQQPFIDDIKETEVKQEIIDTKEEPMETQIENSIFENQDGEQQTENWLDFFSNATELDVDEMIIKPQKKIEEKNDIESLIETNIISKDKEDNNLDNISDVFEIPKIKQEIDEQEATEEINNDEGLSNHDSKQTNVNCKKEHIEDMPNELLTQPTSPKKRIMKYMDPTTGKIYYLEMDRKLDLSKVQEIVINSKGHVKTAKISPIKPNGLKHVRKNSKKGGVSLLKPEIKSFLKNETTKTQTPQKTVIKKNFSHIENDHCYLGPAPFREPPLSSQSVNGSYSETVPTYLEETNTSVKQEESVYSCICAGVKRLCSVRVAVDFCLRKVPLVSSEAKDPDFMKHFPFVVDSEEKYWKYDFAKRRNIEWSRAKLINRVLTEHLTTTETIWRTKQILIYSRLHGYYPIRPETVQWAARDETDWSSWTDLENTRKTESNIKEIYPTVSDICTLTKFNPEEFSQNLSESIDMTAESDEEIEVVNWEEPVRVKKEVLPDLSAELSVLPVQDSQERLRFMFLERICADIGIELRNEDVGNGYSYSAVHAVLLSAMRSFSSEMIRAALADKLRPRDAGTTPTPVWTGSSSSRPLLSLEHVFGGARASPRLHALSARALGAARTDATRL